MIEPTLQGVWMLMLCGPVLLASTVATAYVLRRHAGAGAGPASERSDQLFWDLFFGASIAIPALLIPALTTPWAGFFLAVAAVAAGAAAYQASPRVLQWQSRRREFRLQLPLQQEARARHDQLIERWRRYELDPAWSIQYPEITDVRRAETSALIKAMRTADQLRTGPHQGYPAAVVGFAEALAAAERAAGVPAEQPQAGR